MEAVKMDKVGYFHLSHLEEINLFLEPTDTCFENLIKSDIFNLSDCAALLPHANLSPPCPPPWRLATRRTAACNRILQMVKRFHGSTLCQALSSVT
jgi:hypothetical protein